MVTTFELISIALVTGIGSGIGNPIGQWFYKKFLEQKLDTAHTTVKDVGQKMVNGRIEIPKLDTEQKLRELLGK